MAERSWKRYTVHLVGFCEDTILAGYKRTTFSLVSVVSSTCRYYQGLFSNLPERAYVVTRTHLRSRVVPNPAPMRARLGAGHPVPSFSAQFDKKSEHWCRETQLHVVFNHRACAQRVLHPRAHITPPRRTRLSPPPLHPLHQRPSPVAPPSRLRTLLFLFLRQRRMPLRADPSRRPGAHRVLAGVLPQRACRALPQRYTGTA